MNRIFLGCLAIAVFLCSCASQSPPPDPVLDSVKGKVTAIGSDDMEYHITVEKDSDSVARYSFTYPDEVKGLEYAYVGEQCTVTYQGLELSLSTCPNGVVDRLHLILTNKAPLAYDNDSGSFDGSTENFSFRIFTLSDGNLSIIRVSEPEFCYYFNYDP